METLKYAVKSFRVLLFIMAGFSLFAALLQLTVPLYMLQIYDRVLPSNSTDTLLFLSLLAGFALLVLGCTEIVRQILANRAATRLDDALSETVLSRVIERGYATNGNAQPMRDLQVVQSILSSRVLFNVIDLPFVTIFLAFLYLIHPSIFWLAVAGAILLVFITGLNQWMTKSSNEAQTAAANVASQQAGYLARNSDSIIAMGMTRNVVSNWENWNDSALVSADRSSRINSIFAGISSTLRMGIQIAVLGYGAYLVQAGEMTAGMIFAASLISGRALQPIYVTISSWRQLNAGWRAWKNIKMFLGTGDSRDNYTELASPVGSLSVEAVLQPNPTDATKPPLLNRVSFALNPGESVGVVGASGSGKTTLARIIVGAIKPVAGHVRLDGTELSNWNPDQLGMHIGYVEQDVELLPGTIAQNIARFRSDAKDEDILQAARMAHVEDLIKKMPKGYDTVIGPGGQHVSGGEKQRIALARAFFGNPKLLVLDEPNSSLDRIGENALMRALMAAKQNEITVFLVTQREKVIQAVDKILRMEAGRVTDFDTRDAVIEAHRKIAAEKQAAAVAQASGNGVAGKQTKPTAKKTTRKPRGKSGGEND